MLTCKISKLIIGTILQVWILQAIIAFFSKNVRPRNMIFFSWRVYIWVNIQNKFQVPQSYNIREKCNANCKLSSHFSLKLCDWGTWKFSCKEYLYGLIYKINFKILDCKVSEQNAMLSCKISKLFIWTIVQLWILQVSSHFFRKLCDRGKSNFFCNEYLWWTGPELTSRTK